MTAVVEEDQAATEEEAVWAETAAEQEAVVERVAEAASAAVPGVGAVLSAASIAAAAPRATSARVAAQVGEAAAEVVEVGAVVDVVEEEAVGDDAGRYDVERVGHHERTRATRTITPRSDGGKNEAFKDSNERKKHCGGRGRFNRVRN